MEILTFVQGMGNASYGVGAIIVLMLLVTLAVCWMVFKVVVQYLDAARETNIETVTNNKRLANTIEHLTLKMNEYPKELHKIGEQCNKTSLYISEQMSQTILNITQESHKTYKNLSQDHQSNIRDLVDSYNRTSMTIRTLEESIRTQHLATNAALDTIIKLIQANYTVDERT